MNKKLKKLITNPLLFYKDWLLKRAHVFDLLVELVFPSFRRTYAVVTAVYNVEKYLDYYFRSLTKQSLSFQKYIKLILVDDGSVDSSAAIIKKWQKKFPNNIFYIVIFNYYLFF